MAKIMFFALQSLTLLAAACARFQYNDEWESWKAKYNMKFPDRSSELRRRGIFESNVRFIEEHNSNANLHGYTLGMNAYGHLESEEFIRVHGGLIQDLTSRNGSKVRSVTFQVSELPDEVDWRDKGVVTPVKDQGQCGSCWAFSTTGCLEGQHALKTGDLVSLSEQQLVDCAGGKFKNKGCNGGEPEAAFQYIASVDGEDSEESYPYTAKDGKCDYDPDNVAAGDGGYEMIEEESESDLQEAVANVGPISVCIDASKKSFQFYKDGVYNERRCSQKRLDHAVLAVGYGTQNGTDYWLVKNSWGTDWGMDGYIMMSRNKDNQCGIASDASYPTDVV